MRERLPAAMVPASGSALLAQMRRGEVPSPPAHKVDAPPHGRWMYDPEELRQWCVDQQPDLVRCVLGLLDGSTPLHIEEPAEIEHEARLRPARLWLISGPAAEGRVRALEVGS